MRIQLKDFQAERVLEVREKFDLVRQHPKEYEVVLLVSPTGSGKTLMATSFIEGLLFGDESEGLEGDPNYVFVWLTDQPELNQQTFDKMAGSSFALKDKLVIVDSDLDAEVLSPGKVYFLNTQKLGATTSYVKRGDGREWTLWETLANTMAADPTHFVLMLDEAHRGARGKEAEEAETIMQRFVKGSNEIPKAPVIVAVTATPDRFVQLCGAIARPIRQVVVSPGEVRASGLLKDWVDYYNPEDEQPSDVTMLLQAIEAWKTYEKAWSEYSYSDGETRVRPILMVQVRDKRPNSNEISATDLEMVVKTLEQNLPHEKDDSSWIAHSFQDEGSHKFGGVVVRHLQPSRINSDPNVRVVLFKTSLNTGWDCPRAEVMVSFRPASDPTNIAQLVGRMVRTPLARRIEADEHLNTVALYLPHFNRDAVEKVVSYLQSGKEDEGVTGFRDGNQAVTLVADGTKKDCFECLRSVPSEIIPRTRPMRPVPRLARLASLLAELGWEQDPVSRYRKDLIEVLLAEQKQLAKDPTFIEQVEELRVLEVRRKRVAYGVDGDAEHSELVTKVEVADKNVNDLYAEAGRTLGEGLHIEYLRARSKGSTSGKIDPLVAKVELHVLIGRTGVLEKINVKAELVRSEWMGAHKAAASGLPEKSRVAWREIEGSGGVPSVTTIVPPTSIEVKKAETKWEKHLYVDADGSYFEDLNSWEKRALATELARPDVVAWLRNYDRKPWSLCVKRRDGTGWAGVFPDFLIFRKTKGGIVMDVIDPHLLNDEDAPARAQALAQFVHEHQGSFGRFEMIIFESKSDENGKRLNLMDDQVRAEVAAVTTHGHLRHLFESA